MKLPEKFTSHPARICLIKLPERLFSTSIAAIAMVLTLSQTSFAQTPKIFQDIRYEAEGGFLFSTNSTNPFWNQANQYGQVPLESKLITLRGQLKKEYQDKRKLSYGYGARGVMNAGQRNKIIIPEIYAKVRYKALELYAGRRREMIGLADTLLTSGSYIWSGNALPIPKVELSIQNYIPIFFKSGLLSVKGRLSHGWFGSGDSTKNFLLHQSELYFRIGKPEWHFKIYAGINHQAQWAGRPTVPFYDSHNKVMVNEFGNSMEAYLNVVLGLPIDYATYRFRTGGQVYGEGNRLGNHLGTLDLCLELTDKKSRWLFYRQSLYEDGSLFFLNNITDGLSGLSWTSKSKNSILKKIVVEYLQTSSQGGPLSARAVISQLRGQDNYFNNGLYEEGWVYKGQTIGTPFLMPLKNSTALLDDEKAQLLNPNMILNNRVNAMIVSVQSKISKVALLSRFSTSRNFGSYRPAYRISANQISLQQQVSFQVKEYLLTSSLAYDGHGILKENLGVSLMVNRKF
jgi:hypothetical protein